jgi:hypothetical protein
MSLSFSVYREALSAIAKHAGAWVLGIDYRLAPEYPVLALSHVSSDTIEHSFPPRCKIRSWATDSFSSGASSQSRSSSWYSDCETDWEH